MRYHVPQFIDIEDKVVGPLTIKQFVYIAGGVGFVALLTAFMPWQWAAIIGSPLVLLGLLLAFYQINNQPFIAIMEAAFYYLVSKKLYLWKKNIGVKAQGKEMVGKETLSHTPYVPKVSNNRLKELAWSLDIKDKTGGSSLNQS